MIVLLLFYLFFGLPSAECLSGEASGFFYPFWE